MASKDPRFDPASCEGAPIDTAKLTKTIQQRNLPWPFEIEIGRFKMRVRERVCGKNDFSCRNPWTRPTSIEFEVPRKTGTQKIDLVTFPDSEGEVHMYDDTMGDVVATLGVGDVFGGTSTPANQKPYLRVATVNKGRWPHYMPDRGGQPYVDGFELKCQDDRCYSSAEGPTSPENPTLTTHELYVHYTIGDPEASRFQAKLSSKCFWVGARSIGDDPQWRSGRTKETQVVFAGSFALPR